MSFDSVAWAWRQRGLSPAQKIVLIGLADHTDRNHSTAFPSLSTLAQECELGASTIKAALSELETKGLISREQRWRDDGSRTSNLYNLRLDSGYGRPESGLGVGQNPAKGRPESGLALNKPPNKESSKEVTPDTLRRVSAPKGASPPEGLEGFSDFLTEHLPNCKQTKAFWDAVEFHRRRGVEIAAEQFQIRQWLEKQTGRRRGTNLFVTNWLKNAEAHTNGTGRTKAYQGPDRAESTTPERRPTVFVRPGETPAQYEERMAP